VSSPLSFLQHLRNYVTAGAISGIAGIVSFPILTRSLSVDDYGIMGLVVSTLTLFVAVGKSGVQHSIIRFYSQIKNRTLEYDLNQFCSTVMGLAIALSVLTMAAWLVTGLAILPSFDKPNSLRGYFLVATLFIFFRMIGSIMSNVLNAQQHSRPIMISTVLKRLLHLGMILALLAFSSINVYWVLAAYVASELASVVYVARAYLPHSSHSLSGFNSTLAKSLVVFGLPLMLLESCGLLLRLSDRYLIEFMLGENALGQYAASSNLVSYIEVIILSSLIMAVKPIYNELYESKGEAATSAFLQRGFHIYLMTAIPFVAIFSVTAPHVLNLLASPKYEPGTVVIPYVTASLLFDGAVLFLAAGLYIKKDTRTLLFWGSIATVLNIVLNLLVIPHYGILGAAAVTLVSFVVFAAGIHSSAFKVLAFPIDLRGPMSMAVVSLLLWWVVGGLAVSNDFTAVILKGSVTTVVLLPLLLFFDVDSRELLLSKLPFAVPGLSHSGDAGKVSDAGKVNRVNPGREPRP